MINPELAKVGVKVILSTVGGIGAKTVTAEVVKQFTPENLSAVKQIGVNVFKYGLVGGASAISAYGISKEIDFVVDNTTKICTYFKNGGVTTTPDTESENTEEVIELEEEIEIEKVE